MLQPEYVPVQHDTWATLYRRQRDLLDDKAARLYLDSLDAMDSLTEATIPRVDAMTAPAPGGHRLGFGDRAGA